MRISRRDFLKAAAVAAAAGRITPAALADLRKVLLSRDLPRVIWLHGQGCDGCTISLLNSIHYAGIADVLTGTISLEFHNTVMAAAGDLAVSAAQGAAAEPGYILAVEGAIPTGASGKYCMLWPNMSMYDGLLAYAPDASFILAIGACAAYGGVTAGAPNPTQAQGVGDILGTDPRLINVPGCPAHPDWIVGTITYLLTNGYAPPLDAHRRPLAYYGRQIHHNCLNRATYCGNLPLAPQLSEQGCMEFLGCKGKKTYADCFVRQWNSSGPGEYGVNWCVGSRSPCFGCVEPNFPDGMSPFYVYSPTPEPHSGGGGNGGGQGGSSADAGRQERTNI